MRGTNKWTLALMLSMLATAAVPALAQQGPGGPPQGGEQQQGGGRRGNRGGEQGGQQGGPGGQQGGQQGGEQGGRQGRGGWDPAAMRERRQQQIKEQLGVTEEEWKALQPKIDAVMQAQSASMTGRFAGMGRGRGGPGGPGGGPGGGEGNRGGGGDGNRGGQQGGAQAGGPGGNMPVNPAVEKVRDLQATLENKNAKPEEIKAKLDALRAARAKIQGDLTKAQNELKELLTLRQEAVLVESGVLE